MPRGRTGTVTRRRRNAAGLEPAAYNSRGAHRRDSQGYSVSRAHTSIVSRPRQPRVPPGGQPRTCGQSRAHPTACPGRGTEISRRPPHHTCDNRRHDHAQVEAAGRHQRRHQGARRAPLRDAPADPRRDHQGGGRLQDEARALRRRSTEGDHPRGEEAPRGRGRLRAGWASRVGRAREGGGEVLATYLPKQLSDQELQQIVGQAVEEARAGRVPRGRAPWARS